jgi:hypothetical protein
MVTVGREVDRLLNAGGPVRVGPAEHAGNEIDIDLRELGDRAHVRAPDLDRALSRSAENLIVEIPMPRLSG